MGFICWDPRTLPEFAEIGHNCVAQAYKGLGIGKTQLREALRRISDYGVKKITVTTNETLKPARCNYESAGFIRIRSRKNDSESRFSGDYIDYELLL